MVDYLFYEKSRQRRKKEKTDENSGHYVIASSRPHENRPLERHTLVPIEIARKEISLKQTLKFDLYLTVVIFCI